MSEEFPEHEKLKEVRGKSQAIYDFLEWMRHEKEAYLAKEYTFKEPNILGDGEHDVSEIMEVREPILNLLSEHFGIDQNKLEAEKVKMLDDFRAQTDKG